METPQQLADQVINLLRQPVILDQVPNQTRFEGMIKENEDRLLALLLEYFSQEQCPLYPTLFYLPLIHNPTIRTFGQKLLQSVRSQCLRNPDCVFDSLNPLGGVMKRSVQSVGFQDLPSFLTQTVEAFWSGLHWVLSLLAPDILPLALQRNTRLLVTLHETLPYLRRGMGHITDSVYYYILHCLCILLGAMTPDHPTLRELFSEMFECIDKIQDTIETEFHDDKRQTLLKLVFDACVLLIQSQPSHDQLNERGRRLVHRMNNAVQKKDNTHCLDELMTVIRLLYECNRRENAPSLAPQAPDLNSLLNMETVHFQAYQAGLTRWSLDDFDAFWIPHVWQERFSRDSFDFLLHGGPYLPRLLVSLPAQPNSRRPDQWEAWIRKIWKACETHIRANLPLLLYFLLTPSHRIRNQVSPKHLAPKDSKEPSLLRPFFSHPQFVGALQGVLVQEEQFLASAGRVGDGLENPAVGAHAGFLQQLLVEVAVAVKEKVITGAHQDLVRTLWELVSRVIISCPHRALDADWSGLFRCAHELSKPTQGLASFIPNLYRGPLVTRALPWCPHRYPQFKRAYYGWLRDYLPEVMNKSFLDTPVIQTFHHWLQNEEHVFDLKKYELNNLLSSVIHSEYIGEETVPPQYFPQVKKEGAAPAAPPKSKPKRKIAHRSRSRGRSRGRSGSDSSSGGEEDYATVRRARSRSRKRSRSDHRAQKEAEAEAEDERLREVLAERNARSRGVIALPSTQPQSTKRRRYASRSRSRGPRA